MRELGGCPPLFAYPNGNYSNAAIRVLAATGFRVAFTTRRGVNILSEPPSLQLRRESGRASRLGFALQLTEPIGTLRALAYDWRARLRDLRGWTARRRADGDLSARPGGRPNGPPRRDRRA